MGQQKSKGFVYFSFGKSYIDETFVSVKTLLQHNLDAKICFITDDSGRQYVEQSYSDVALDQIKCVTINPNEGIWAFRLSLNELTPYDKTIYLDGDTYITSDIQDLFDLVDTFDFVAVPDESHPARGFILGLKGGYKALNYYNCGFFIFKKSETVHQLFKTWKQEYVDLAPLEPGDQGPLIRALIKTPVRFITLPQEYNLRLLNKCASFQSRVKIIHGRAKDPEKIIKMINDIDFIDKGSRVWLPHLQRVIKVSQFRNYFRFLKLFNLVNIQESAHKKEEARKGLTMAFFYLKRKFKNFGFKFWEFIKSFLKLSLYKGGFRKHKEVKWGDFVTSLNFPHLGGNIRGGDVHSFDKVLFDYLLGHHQIRSVFDCGCGEGHIAKYFEDHGMRTVALDGLQQNFVCKNVVIHDLAQSAYVSKEKFDLVWCCEVAGHIHPRHVNNLVITLTQNASNLILMTHGLPGQEGYHHVNLHEDWYWTQLITDRGFYFNPHLTLHLRDLSQGKYFKRSGLVFEREKRNEI